MEQYVVYRVVFFKFDCDYALIIKKKKLTYLFLQEPTAEKLSLKKILEIDKDFGFLKKVWTF